MKAIKTGITIIAFACIFLMPITLFAQGLNIGTGGYVIFKNAPILIINNGGIINNGNYVKASESVILSGSTPNTLTGSSNTSVQNMSVSNTGGITTYLNQLTASILTIVTGGKFIVETGKTVNVSSTVTNNNGNAGILIKSRVAESNGSFIFNNTAPQATVEMYTLASKVDNIYRWQYFGIPVASLPLTTIPSPVAGSFVRRMYETGTTSATQWVPLTNSSTMIAFAGYEITQVSAKTINFTGTLVNDGYSSGNLTYTTGANRIGQHLIGNSYTAAIDISQIVFANDNIHANVMLYNTGSGSDWNSAGSGVGSGTEIATPGQYIVIPKSAAGTNGLPGQIPSMQAFLVQVKNNLGTSISIPYSAVATNTTKQRAPAAQRPSTRINVTSDNSVYSDVMWLISDASCTRGYENGWDGAKYVSEITAAPQLYAKETSGNYQVNSVNDFNNTNLGFVAGEAENYTFTFTSENLNLQYPALYLYDRETNNVIDITTTGTQYSFTATPNSTATNRFKILTSPDLTTGDMLLAGDVLKVYSSNNQIFVENSSRSNATIKLFDVSGRIITTKLIAANSTTQLNVNLKSGIYMSKTTMHDSGLELISKVHLK